MCYSTINSSNKSKQTGLNRCTHSALLHTYTCQVQKVLCALIGWGLTSKSAWAIAVELCTEMFTYTHFLFLWVLVSYHSCWLIKNPDWEKGHAPPASAFFTWVTWLAAGIDLMGIWQHVYMIHTHRWGVVWEGYKIIQSAVYEREWVWEGRHRLGQMMMHVCKHVWVVRK